MIAEKDQWLTVVRPLLAGIRYDAHWIRHYCDGIREKVRRLPNKPSFKTEAEAEIDKAARLLMDAIDALYQAQEEFRSKPTDGQNNKVT